jgi:hypothetical protein
MPVVVPSKRAGARSLLRHVFIVGAGFSREISETMPTLDQLGTELAADLRARPSFRLLPEAADAARLQAAASGPGRPAAHRRWAR